MDGRGAVIELYHISNDLHEDHNLAQQYPERIKKMAACYYQASTEFPSPIDWELSKWEEIKDSSLFLNAMQ